MGGSTRPARLAASCEFHGGIHEFPGGSGRKTLLLANEFRGPGSGSSRVRPRAVEPVTHGGPIAVDPGPRRGGG